MKKNNTLLEFWVEMVQEDETKTLIYFRSFESFKQAMKATANNAYNNFWEWYFTPYPLCKN